jgi:iron complex outermembrane receptor protein
VGNLRTLLRANYYGEWDDTGNDVPGMSAEILIDAEVAYMFRDNIEFIAGVDNLFDTYPDDNPFAGDLGQIYSEASPFGFNGMSWYLRARLTF